MELNRLLSVVKKMIVKGKLQGHFEEDNMVLVLDKGKQGDEFQELSAQYVDKLEYMVENNERLLDMMTGGNLSQWQVKGTVTEIQQINQSRKQRMAVKPTTRGGRH